MHHVQGFLGMVRVVQQWIEDFTKIVCPLVLLIQHQIGLFQPDLFIKYGLDNPCLDLVVVKRISSLVSATVHIHI
jgi:hypothetical protein